MQTNQSWVHTSNSTLICLTHTKPILSPPKASLGPGIGQRVTHQVSQSPGIIRRSQSYTVYATLSCLSCGVTNEDNGLNLLLLLILWPPDGCWWHLQDAGCHHPQWHLPSVAHHDPFPGTWEYNKLLPPKSRSHFLPLLHQLYPIVLNIHILKTNITSHICPWKSRAPVMLMIHTSKFLIIIKIRNLLNLVYNWAYQRLW